MLPTAGPAYAAARSALAEAWDGTAPADMGTGGSIPFIAESQERFPARASPSRRRGPRHPHARPERGAPPAEFERAVLAEALLLQRLGGA